VGAVEAVYGDVAQEQYGYLIGQRVVGEINAACHRLDCYYCQHGIPIHCPNRTTLGIVNHDEAFAEYLTLPLENLHIVPDTISDEEVVFVEPLAPILRFWSRYTSSQQRAWSSWVVDG
jgi:threonine dehydrogenase-like Zn-dependent dehydrogenase